MYTYVYTIYTCIMNTETLYRKIRQFYLWTLITKNVQSIRSHNHCASSAVLQFHISQFHNEFLSYLRNSINVSCRATCALSSSLYIHKLIVITAKFYLIAKFISKIPLIEKLMIADQ